MCFKSVACGIISFLAGILVDVDHFIDYYINCKFTLSIKDVYDYCVNMKFKKIYVFLHSFELVIILWLTIYALSLSNLWKAFAIGITQHILIDQITNPIIVPGYFLLYRMAKYFRKDLLMREVEGR